jgi:hypothetical protein
MTALLSLLAIAASLSQAAAPAPTASAEDAAKLFKSLEGQWSCSGAFANGKPLAADLSFTRSPDGRSIHYSHVDRAPSDYRQSAHWGLDKDSGHIVSLTFVGFGEEARPSASMYVDEGWSANSLTLVHKKLISEPFAPNRFTYTSAGDTLKMLWEVGRGDIWKMGDYLDCKKAPAVRK